MTFPGFRVPADPEAFKIKLADLSQNALKVDELEDGPRKDKLRAKYEPVAMMRIVPSQTRITMSVMWERGSDESQSDAIRSAGGVPSENNRCCFD